MSGVPFAFLPKLPSALPGIPSSPSAPSTQSQTIRRKVQIISSGVRDKHGQVSFSSGSVKVTVKRNSHQLALSKSTIFRFPSQVQTQIGDFKFISDSASDNAQFAAIAFLQFTTDPYIDLFEGEGHAIEEGDNYTGELIQWKINGNIMDLQSGETANFSEINCPKFVRANVLGLKQGANRLLFAKHKIACIRILDVHKISRRVNIGPVYEQLTRLEKKADWLVQQTEASIRRKRLSRSINQLKQKLTNLDQIAIQNTLDIEDMLDQRKQMINRLHELEKSKKRSDINSSIQKRDQLLEKVNLIKAKNATLDKTEEMELEGMKYEGVKRIVSNCITDAFVAVCCAMNEGEGTIEQRLEEVKRQILESLYI